MSGLAAKEVLGNTRENEQCYLVKIFLTFFKWIHILNTSGGQNIFITTVYHIASYIVNICVLYSMRSDTRKTLPFYFLFHMLAEILWDTRLFIWELSPYPLDIFKLLSMPHFCTYKKYTAIPIQISNVRFYGPKINYFRLSCTAKSQNFAGTTKKKKNFAVPSEIQFSRGYSKF